MRIGSIDVQMKSTSCAHLQSQTKSQLKKLKAEKMDKKKTEKEITRRESISGLMLFRLLTFSFYLV